MTRSYSDCYFCGGQVDEQTNSREIWWHGKLHLIENVPMGVCRQCGHKTILPAVAKSIDNLLAGAVPPDEFVEVPAYQFRETDVVPQSN